MALELARSAGLRGGVSSADPQRMYLLSQSRMKTAPDPTQNSYLLFNSNSGLHKARGTERVTYRVENQCLAAP